VFTKCFEYTVAPRRRPPRYRDHFTAVFPIIGVGAG